MRDTVLIITYIGMADNSILISGLDEALNDAATWRETFVIGDPATGQPMDITGRAFLITFRVITSWAEVVTAGTELSDGSLVPTGQPGELRLQSLPSQRPYQVPLGAGAGYERSVRGDVLSWPKTSPDQPEYLGYIQFNLRASTTRVSP